MALTLRLSSLPSRRHCYPSLPLTPSISSLQFRYPNHNRQFAKLHVSSPHSTSLTAPTINTHNAADREPNPTPPSETFDWFAHWYPLALLCDLDKNAPKGITVLGLDVVVWWDRAEGRWKVFDDRCPHRLAPLSEGRIDHRGRLQCVYHGWCFNGAGACKFIPQAPALGPPVQNNEKACVGVYPSIEQNGLLWFWPNSSPQYKDIMHKSGPPYFPELDDPAFTYTKSARDVLYGYEILTENIVDPAHLPYAHYGIMDLRQREDPGRVETDKEGGSPLELTMEESDINGFVAKQDTGYHKFIAPCVYYFSLSKNTSESGNSSGTDPKLVTFFLCVPVRPGKSRIISITGRNYATFIDKYVPRWYYHIGFNLVIDSDLYLLHAAERRLASEGISNWHNSCYVPTQSDMMVVAFKTWLRKYSNSQVNWGNKSFAPLAVVSRDQLMNRYWTHVVNCKSCSGALKALKAVKICLQVASVALIGILAVSKNTLVSSSTKTTLLLVAVMCFGTSHWLSQFIHKIFYYHDYNHSVYRTANTLLGRIIGSI